MKLLTIVGMLLLSSCAYQQSTLPPEEASVIRGERQRDSHIGLSIEKIDGEAVKYFGVSSFGPYKLAPGEHEVQVRFFYGPGLLIGSTTMTMILEPGKSYIIRGRKLEGRHFEAWTEMLPSPLPSVP